LYEIVDGLTRLMAPVLTFMAAEVWDFLPGGGRREDNVCVALFPELKPERVEDKDLAEKWDKVLRVRGELTKALEIARRDKVIGHSLEAEVVVAADGALGDFLVANWQTVQSVAIVSGLELLDSLPEPGFVSTELPELSVLVRPARGGKCERCWLRSEELGSDAVHPSLCPRCTAVVVDH
jgi:isoleucyl-tRNA synthetase